MEFFKYISLTKLEKLVFCAIFKDVIHASKTTNANLAKKIPKIRSENLLKISLNALSVPFLDVCTAILVTMDYAKNVPKLKLTLNLLLT